MKKSNRLDIELPPAHTRSYQPWPGSKSIQKFKEERAALMENENGIQPSTAGAMPQIKIPGLTTTVGAVPKMSIPKPPKAAMKGKP